MPGIPTATRTGSVVRSDRKHVALRRIDTTGVQIGKHTAPLDESTGVAKRPTVAQAKRPRQPVDGWVGFKAI